MALGTTSADTHTSGQQSSGVQVNSQCLDSFQELKLGKSASPPLTPAKGSRAKPVSFSACCAETKYIVFKLSADNTQIEVEKTSPSASYDDFLNDLPPNSPRYAVYDFEYEKDGGKRNKICFYAWSPDEAKIKEKMLYASSKDALRRSLVGVANEIQGTDSSEVAYDEGTLPPALARILAARVLTRVSAQSSTRSRAVPRKESAARDSTLPSSIFFPPRVTPRHRSYRSHTNSFLLSVMDAKTCARTPPPPSLFYFPFFRDVSSAPVPRSLIPQFLPATLICHLAL